jgi:hypothetical protein
MGKLNMGILGGFSGTVGTVVGSTNRKGEDIIRVKSKKPRTSNTEGQMNQRTKFGLVTGFMQPLNFLLKTGFKCVAAGQMSPYNYACREALNNGIAGDAPDFELDYGKLQLSSGGLSLVLGASAGLVAGKVNFQWEDNTGNCVGSATDKMVLVVYNVDKAEVSFSIGEFSRSSKAGVVPLPYGESGDNLLFYLFLQSTSDTLQVSTSMLVGNAVLIL